MKTRLTNNYLDFVKHIEVELSKPFSAESRIVFSMFPALNTGHFSIQLIDGDSPFLLVKQWIQDLHDSYQRGLYNLDNVRIWEQRISISDKDLLTIRSLAEASIEIKELDGIIIDGVEFELRINIPGKANIYRWQTDRQISNGIKELTKKLVDIAGLRK